MQSGNMKTKNIIIPVLILSAVAFSILRNAPHPMYKHLKLEINLAIMGNDIETIESLIESGIDLNRKEKSGAMMTPLHVAVSMNRPEIISILIKKGAEVNNTDKNGETPLHYALKGPYIAEEIIVKTLIENNASPELKSVTGDTPLHYAPGFADDSTFSFILEKVKEINIKNNAGRTPLHQAVFYMKTGSVNLLIQHGADSNIRDSQGNTPLDLIKKNITRYSRKNMGPEKYDKRLIEMEKIIKNNSSGT